MKITFNNEIKTVEPSCSVESFLLSFSNEQHFAVVVNRQFLPKSEYATKQLKEGDVIDVIIPMQGG